VLRELVPTTTTMAVLVNPTNNPANVEIESRRAQAAANALGLQAIHVLQASTEAELERIFPTLIQQRAGGLVITADTLFSGKSAELAALASRHSMPTISPYREFPIVGGLMSYGGNVTQLYRLVGVYTGRVLNGEKPENLPVQQVTKVDLVINLRTAKALGQASIFFPVKLLPSGWDSCTTWCRRPFGLLCWSIRPIRRSLRPRYERYPKLLAPSACKFRS
jgi:putative ABC transport system substrate-binding protein